ncbi:MAG: phosphoethanolamine transferase [Rhodocyclaceae bacterium]|nr:phosphoethanolamine transferase [Rhodocyclaceae bacterium]
MVTLPTAAGPAAVPGRFWPSLGALAALLASVIVLGHDGRRVAQLLLLALPLLAWLCWPVRSAGVHRLRQAAVTLWVLAFALDGVVRAYLLDTYQSAPDGAMVLGAAANTNPRESAEYLSMHWRTALLWLLAVLAAAGCAWRLAARGRRGPSARLSRWVAAGVAAVLLLSGVAYASKPWRRLHPVLFWSGWQSQLETLRAGWADQQRVRDAALARARAAAPVIAREGPSTVVLVITDSINRDNLGLYGYRRATTPRLQAQQRQLGEQLTVLRNAWSVDASTLPALRNLFAFGEPDRADPQHLLAMARAAGYKTWWMSNHDDVAIEQQHARLADVVDIVNRTPGRASASLDSELLDCVQEALEDPAERKLIVVHLLGAHPHYTLRFPPGQNPFDDEVDAVESDMARNGRSAWVRRFRQEYDAALLYHDFVVAEMLQLTRTVGRTDGYRAWMYLSDHGQEVGHGSDRAGHSPSTESGYRIPALVWRNQPPPPDAATPADAALRPFRADWAGWTLADLLALRWNGLRTERDVLAAGYRWEAPTLPLAVRSFTD